jgi:DNA-binding response OmpR family regulator
MAERLIRSPKVMMVSNQRNTGPLLGMSLQFIQHMNLVLETDPEKAVNTWAQEIPDLIIIDVNLEPEALLHLISSLRFETAVPILLLITSQKEEFQVQAHEAGVDECIQKPIGISLFQAKVRAWMNRSRVVSIEALNSLKVGELVLMCAERELVLGDAVHVRLTTLELRLLFALMSQPGRAIPFEVLIEQVWGSTLEGDVVALKNVVYRLRQKIEANTSEPSILLTVAGMGYCIAAPLAEK